MRQACRQNLPSGRIQEKEAAMSIEQQLLEEDEVRLMEPLLAELDPEDWEDAAHYENQP
jgi:hypothetical protein